ncbi:ras guanine nucleotide exchange factor domain-containing protein [Infundibulicybe gibba]|nr:ras guanine nucleotide exchange factor domain-containing protein [Infundibulicybe gibba]
MPALSLAAISGRAHALTKGRKIHPPSILNLEDHPLGNPPRCHPDADNATESVCSDSAAPPSSGIIPSPALALDLEKSFPSILSAVDRMRSLQGSADIHGMHALGLVFSTCLRTIVKILDRLPCGVRTNPEYSLARCGTIFTADLFRAQTARLQTEQLPGIVSEGIDTALELVDMTISGLRKVLEAADRVLSIKDKPLPDLPIFSAEQHVEPDHPSLAVVVAEVLDEVSCSETVGPDLEPHAEDRSPSGLSGNNAPAKRWRFRRDEIIRRIVKRIPNSSKASLFSHGSGSSMTFVDCSSESDVASFEPLPKQSFRSNDPVRLPDVPYSIRQSDIFFRADPYAPELDVDMPLPVGEAVAVRLDHAGMMKAASLPALVRILTSKEGLLSAEFTTTFFLCFRFFSSPTQFLELLINRFHEQPAASLSHAQLRVWAREATLVRIRVGRAILMWLEQYWKPGLDECVLGTLRSFALDHLVPGLPELLATKLLAHLSDVSSHDQGSGAIRKSRYFQKMSDLSVAKDMDPTGFVIPPCQSGDVIAQIMKYNSLPGKEELARQLTVRMSEELLKVDPEDAVAHWIAGGKSEVGNRLQKVIDFECSLGLFVSHTILQGTTQEARVEIIAFWIDIAMNCQRLRNFSSSHSVYCGFVDASISRLRRTLLLLPIASKEKYKYLEDLFTGHGNYGKYRRALAEEHLPAVPILAPLIHDITVTEGIPDQVSRTQSNREQPPTKKEQPELVNMCLYRIIVKTIRVMESCLIPYKLTRDGTFHTWLDESLLPFPPHSTGVISKGYDKKSNEIEPREPFWPGSTWLHIYTTSSQDLRNIRNMYEPEIPPPNIPTQPPSLMARLRKF